MNKGGYSSPLTHYACTFGLRPGRAAQSLIAHSTPADNSLYRQMVRFRLSLSVVNGAE